MEEMSAFFTSRVAGYDEHMLREVEGCREGYALMASLLPKGARTLLDLGCGTGLELDEIYKLLPDIAVTGIDMTRAMLDALATKHGDKRLALICGSYFDTDFGERAFDAAVSFETLHHWPMAKKAALFKRVRAALNEGGVYLECDYFAEDEAEERFYFGEYAALVAREGLDASARYHYDTPLTIAHELDALREAGFSRALPLWRMANTALLIARK